MISHDRFHSWALMLMAANRWTDKLTDTHQYCMHYNNNYNNMLAAKQHEAKQQNIENNYRIDIEHTRCTKQQQQQQH